MAQSDPGVVRQRVRHAREQAPPGQHAGWHVNRGPDKAADFHPASRFAAAFKKPDVVLAALDGV